ncbi:MAG: hypothetical protein HY846_01870 [Nitrosomonadales bacterium]|nr:hypothetical protein [Nitrosomonadales bacterium]
MSDTIELVRFRLQQGKTSADWLKANEKINNWMEGQPGFRFRSLSETDDGEWLDLVYWESLEAANAASEKFGAEMMSVCEPLVAHDSVVISRSKAHVMQRG